MSALSIDTDATAAAVRTWVRWGDDLSRSQLDLANDLDRLQLGDVIPMAGWSITAAATGAKRLTGARNLPFFIFNLLYEG